MAPIIAELFHFSLPTPSGGQIFLLAQKDLDEKGRLGGGLCTRRPPPKYPLLRKLRQFLANAWAGCPDPAPAGVVRVISIELHYTLVRTITHEFWTA